MSKVSRLVKFPSRTFASVWEVRCQPIYIVLSIFGTFVAVERVSKALVGVDVRFLREQRHDNDLDIEDK